jgi:arylsulfatase A-like enzyme
MTTMQKYITKLNNNNLTFIKIVFLLISVFFFTCEDKVTKPNIILLLADDLGYNELGSYGQKIIQTPELDRMAKAGMKFTNFYAGNAACAPSRAVLLTGKNATNVAIRGNAGYFGNDRWEGVALDQDAFTLGEMLKGQGYQTAFIGKWHLDNPDDVNTWAYGHEFDYAAQEQWQARFNPTRTFPPNRLWVNGDEEYIPYDYKKYSCKDELRTDLAFDFLENREKENPFFLFMSYRAPHSFEGPIRDTLFYADQDWPEIEQAHAAKITLLDRQIGRLLRQLEKIGALDNTLVIFTSDNGPHFALGGHDHEFFDSNGALRGGKRDLYEGGIRVPMLVSWKGKVSPGTITEHILGFQDVMPTFAEIAGAPIPEQTDGISFLPLLVGEQQKKHDFLNWEYQMSGWFQTLPNGGFRQSIRRGNWKAVRYGVNAETELYNLDKDISEANNLAEAYPQILEEMNARFASARTETPGFPFGGLIQDYKSMDRYKPNEN